MTGCPGTHWPRALPAKRQFIPESDVKKHSKEMY